MPQQILIIGGTSGIGRELAARYTKQGAAVVIAGRDAERAAKVAAELNAKGATDNAVRGIEVDLSKPEVIADALSDIAQVDAIVLAGMQRDRNTVQDYNTAGAKELVITKLVGYTEVLHVLQSRISPNGSVLLFGGTAKDAPYPGSTTVTAVNAGVVGLVTTLSKELAPVRVNAIHPGLVGDSPYWAQNDAAVESARARTLTGKLATTQEIVDGCVFLLENAAADGIHLHLDGGRA